MQLKKARRTREAYGTKVVTGSEAWVQATLLFVAVAYWAHLTQSLPAYFAADMNSITLADLALLASGRMPSHFVHPGLGLTTPLALFARFMAWLQLASPFSIETLHDAISPWGLLQEINLLLRMLTPVVCGMTCLLAMKAVTFGWPSTPFHRTLVLAMFLTQGSWVYVTGRLRSEHWALMYLVAGCLAYMNAIQWRSVRHTLLWSVCGGFLIGLAFFTKIQVVVGMVAFAPAIAWGCVSCIAEPESRISWEHGFATWGRRIMGIAMLLICAWLLGSMSVEIDGVMANDVDKPSWKSLGSILVVAMGIVWIFAGKIKTVRGWAWGHLASGTLLGFALVPVLGLLASPKWATAWSYAGAVVRLTLLIPLSSFVEHEGLNDRGVLAALFTKGFYHLDAWFIVHSLIGLGAFTCALLPKYKSWRTKAVFVCLLEIGLAVSFGMGTRPQYHDEVWVGIYHMMVLVVVGRMLPIAGYYRAVTVVMLIALCAQLSIHDVRLAVRDGGTADYMFLKYRWFGAYGGNQKVYEDAIRSADDGSIQVKEVSRSGEIFHARQVIGALFPGAFLTSGGIAPLLEGCRLFLGAPEIKLNAVSNEQDKRYVVDPHGLILRTPIQFDANDVEEAYNFIQRFPKPIGPTWIAMLPRSDLAIYVLLPEGVLPSDQWLRPVQAIRDTLAFVITTSATDPLQRLNAFLVTGYIAFDHAAIPKGMLVVGELR